MNKRYLPIGILIMIMILFSSCGKTNEPVYGPDTMEGSADGNTTSVSGDPADTSVSKKQTPIGTWYEQSEFGGVLKVSEKKIRYIAYENRYTDEVDLTIVRKGSKVLLQTKEEDYFTFVDMTYDKKEDIIRVHDWPHTDGDGGYHLIEFRRTVYTPPPPPVYDPPVDDSDPDAKTVFEDLTIRSMKVSFYDAGPYYDPNSSMAQQPPFEDNYSYDLQVTGDGSALVSSSFCQEIDIPKETVDELQALINEADLGAINGLDIHTPGLPADAADYTLELELASGEIIHSSANGDNVPENWLRFQEPMHHLLFFAFVDAGYNYYREDFHSTKPMKRLGSAASENPLKVDYDYVLIVPDWKKSYNYDLDTKYLIFNGTDPSRPKLLETLQGLSDYYKEKAEASLKEDYQMMEAVPKSVWKKADRLYCYSFYVVDFNKSYGSFYSFLMSEGHANSLGVGKNGYGNYPYVRYNIDTETGKLLSAADLFISADAACEVITNTLREKYGTYREEGKYIHTDQFPEALKNYIGLPAPEGIAFNASYDSVDLTFPKALFPMADDYNLTVTLYYDELQDVLSDVYCDVW